RASQPSAVRFPTLSARTIEPKRVSPPSEVGWPPRSRTLRQPSQTRSRLRSNGRELDASEGRRRGVFDPDLSESPRCGRAREDDRRVPPRAAAQERRIGPARALDEHLLDPADPGSVPPPRDPLDDLDQPLDPFALDVLGHLVRQRRSLRALARRVDEREGAVVADLLDRAHRLLELRLGLAGEADDQVSRQREIRNRAAK